MVERSRIRLLTGALASVLLPGLSGCAWPPYEGPPRGYAPHRYDYYYYPHEDVYYHIYTDHYYYRDGPVWWHSQRLPDHIRLDSGYRVWLRIWDDKPWRRHHKHRRKYPPPPRPNHYYDYWYYPHRRVYFHIYTGWYFYHHRGSWRRVRRLPSHMRLDWRRRHLLNIRERKPWQRHDEHRRKYPPSAEPRRSPRLEPAPQPRKRRTPDIRRGRPPASPEPPPPPKHRRDRERDRKERDHNIRRHKEYRKKPLWPPRD